MTKFSYRAVSSDGRSVSGEIDADISVNALAALRQKGVRSPD